MISRKILFFLPKSDKTSQNIMNVKHPIIKGKAINFRDFCQQINQIGTTVARMNLIHSI